MNDKPKQLRLDPWMDLVHYAKELNEDYGSDTDAHVWYRYCGANIGWWLHGRTHNLGGTEYFGFIAISRDDAIRLVDEGHAWPMYEHPKNAEYDNKQINNMPS